jgi:hypothetical protein
MATRIISSIYIFFLIAGSISAQTNTFIKILGGSNTDVAYDIINAHNGGYIVTGSTKSYGNGVGIYDAWTIRIKANGDTLWTKTYGGGSTDKAFNIKKTTDGGYVQTGFYSNWSYDVFALKTDSSGNKIWQKAHGYKGYDYGNEIIQTNDGLFAITGFKNDTLTGIDHLYLLKLKSNGDTLWTKKYTGTTISDGSGIIQMPDSGFIISGSVSGIGNGASDVYLLRVDKNGAKLWEKTFGGAGYDWGRKIIQTQDSGFAIIGLTNSFGQGDYDVYLIKTDINGNLIWEKTFGNSKYDQGYSIKETSDKGFVITGSTESYGSGKSDVYLIRTDSTGNKIWQKTFGGSGYEIAYSVELTPDNGIITAGYTNSYGAGKEDFYIVKTDENGCFLQQGETSLDFSVSSINPKCYNASDGTASLNITGGTSPFSYTWSNGATGSTANNLPAGNHSVTVTSPNNCSKVKYFSFTNPAPLSATLSPTPVNCYGNYDGSISVNTVSGNSPYNYLWSNGQTAPSATGLNSGTHKVTITDNNGCKGVFNSFVSSPAQIIASINEFDATCGQSDGYATASPDSGFAPYTYLWSNGQTDSISTGLNSGTYSVTITDSANCSAVFIANISNSGSPDLTYITDSVTCNGYSDGNINITVTGGTSPYSYQWSNGLTTEDINSLPNGIYTVTITDSSLCNKITSIKVSQPDSITALFNITDASNDNTPDGSINITASGGTSPYNFLWSNGITTANNTGILPGTYTITITDNNGCIANFTDSVGDLKVGIYHAGIQNSKYIVYPNPVSGNMFYVKTETSIANIVTISIYGYNGSLIYNKPHDFFNNTTQLILLPETISSGIYLVIFENANERQKQIIVVK